MSLVWFKSGEIAQPTMTELYSQSGLKGIMVLAECVRWWAVDTHLAKPNSAKPKLNTVGLSLALPSLYPTIHPAAG